MRVSRHELLLPTGASENECFMSVSTAIYTFIHESVGTSFAVYVIKGASV
jgi:hypothetical protein